MKRVILVQFDLNAKEYAYFTDDDTIKDDDLVVVDARGEYKLTRVTQTTGISKFDITKANKWVIVKVDVTAHEERLKKAQLVQEIENKLDQRMQQVNRYAQFQLMAKEDAGMMELLEQLGSVAPDLVPSIAQITGAEGNDTIEGADSINEDTAS